MKSFRIYRKIGKRWVHYSTVYHHDEIQDHLDEVADNHPNIKTRVTELTEKIIKET